MEYDPSLVGSAGLNCKVSVTSLFVSRLLAGYVASWRVDTVYSLRYIGLTPIALFAIPSHILGVTVWNQICFRNLIWDMSRFAKKCLDVECSHNSWYRQDDGMCVLMKPPNVHMSYIFPLSVVFQPWRELFYCFAELSQVFSQRSYMDGIRINTILHCRHVGSVGNLHLLPHFYSHST